MGDTRYTIFEYFSEQHYVTLLESDIDEVENLVNKKLKQKIEELEIKNESTLQKAWNDGRDCSEQRCGYFDIENYLQK